MTVADAFVGNDNQDECSLFIHTLYVRFVEGKDAFWAKKEAQNDLRLRHFHCDEYHRQGHHHRLSTFITP